jgi:hypothetical protein
MKRAAQLDSEAAVWLGRGSLPRVRPSNHSAVVEATDCRGRWPSVRHCPNRGVRRRRDPNTPSEPETVIRHNSYKSGSCKRTHTHTPGNTNTMDYRRCWSGTPGNCKATTNRCSAFRSCCNTEFRSCCNTGRARSPRFPRATRAQRLLLLQVSSSITLQIQRSGYVSKH